MLSRHSATMLSGLALACLTLVAPQTRAGGAPEAALPAMRGAEIVEVASHMRISGTPTHIREFRIERPLDEVLTHYREWFGRRRVEREVMGWRVMARKEAGTLLTVRARADGPEATVGTLSVADLEAGGAALGRTPGLVLPAASEITSDLEMDDPGRQSRLLTLRNPASPAANAAHFRRTFEARGYHLQHDLPANGQYRGRTLWFAAGAREAIVVIVDLGDHTAVTVNTVRREAASR